jgi:PilZ domain
MRAARRVDSVSGPRMEPRVSNLRDLSVQYEGRDELVRTRTPDVSTRGMFINTNQRFPEGAILSVRFRLARSGTEIRARAEVRYCSPGVGVGVEFTDISAESVAAIQREIDRSIRRSSKSGTKKRRSKRTVQRARTTKSR